MDKNLFIESLTDTPQPEIREGHTLREWMITQAPMGPERFISFAKMLAGCVELLHKESTLHLDLKPEVIGVSADLRHIFLLDSGFALKRSIHGYERPSDCGLNSGALPYCSPENTGRMQRTVDERSDLYSLGVIFYEILTGSLPFEADNALEWVYKHLTQEPLPLSRLGISLPDGLEAIITKLLEKNPDRRYRNISYLLADLDQWGSTQGNIKVQGGFHGRAQEVSLLTQAFYSACLGSTEMVYLSGEAGIGKSSLMDEVFRKQDYSREFFYITGKFEQIANESPYQPIIQAFRGLMRHWLGGSREHTEHWKLKLQKALGINASVITTIIPEVELLIGSAPAVEELPVTEAQKRFIYVFRKFVQIIATKEHPLVLFIDDVQWANASSLQLIHALLSDPECQYLLLVCAYRPEETDLSILPGIENDGRLTDQTTVRRIHLSALQLEQMNLIAMETLSSRADRTLTLTELLYPQSGGNPFHFKQILLRLQNDGILQYNQVHQHWHWNLGQLIEQESSYAIDDLMKARLQRLSPDVQQLLRIAACVGSTFHPKLIAGVADLELQDIHSHWLVMETEGFILRGEEDSFRFTHDNIQKLIYNEIEEPSRSQLHLSIGQYLKSAWLENEEYPFDAVNHLNQGSRFMKSPDELLALVKLNQQAGHLAKASTAYDVALGYFRHAAELLPDDYWTHAFEFCFALYIQKAECEYLCGYFQRSDQDIDFLLSMARGPGERSQAQMLRIAQYINQGKYLEGTALGLDSLKEHRIFIPHKPSRRRLFMEHLRMEALLFRQGNQLKSLPEMSDPEQITAMNLLFSITPSTFFTNKNVFFLLMCKGLQLSLKYGNTPISSAVYTSIGMLKGSLSGKHNDGYNIGRIGVELSDRYNIPSIKSQTYTMFGGVLSQFAGDVYQEDAYLTEALKLGMDSGDYVFASYAIGAHVNSLYTRVSTGELAKTIADYMVILDTTNDEFVKQNFYLYQQYILALQGRTAAPGSFNTEEFGEEDFLARISREETSATTMYQYSTYKLQLYYLLGDYHEAIRWGQKAKSNEGYGTHLPHMAEGCFYELLSILAVCTQRRTLSRKQQRGIRRLLRRFSNWAACNPSRYQSRLYLLQAEHAKTVDNTALAEELYDKAIREARERNDLQVTSLANELAALYYWQNGKGKTALFHIGLALDGYKQWEVQLKVSAIEDLIGEWKRVEWMEAYSESSLIQSDGNSDIVPASSRYPAHEHQMAEHPDLIAILQTTQALSHSPDYDSVLNEIMGTVLRYAGANKGALVTSSNELLSIQVCLSTDSLPAAFPLPLDNSSLLPEGLIRFVFRTQEPVRYSGESDSWLIHNPYIAEHRPQSVLCLPVTVRGNLLGVLYLENRLTSDVFASERVPVLLAMASQALLMCVLQEGIGQAEYENNHNNHPAMLNELNEPLTERELEVLALLAAGLSNKEIAEHLVIAIGTVKVHVKNIFAKLKVNRRTKAIAQAKELRLLD